MISVLGDELASSLLTILRQGHPRRGESASGGCNPRIRSFLFLIFLIEQFHLLAQRVLQLSGPFLLFHRDQVHFSELPARPGGRVTVTDDFRLNCY